jgi:8-oxo-dGTP pyrophosphatase MutT (NUDIX family)
MNPWTLLGSTSAYRNHWINVREDRVLRPDGEPSIYGVVEIPPSIAVLAVDSNDQLLLIGQWRYTRNKYSWEIAIGSSAPEDSNIQETAARELREEAGVEAAHWTALGTLEASIGVTTDTQWIFLATELTKGASTPDPDEQLATRWVPFADAVRMVLRGEICEAASTASILKLDALRRYGLLS